VRCEEVRPLLPAYAEPEPRPAGAVDLHLAGCPSCRGELQAYRSMLADLAELRDVGEDASAEALAHAIELIPTPGLGARLSGSLAANRRLYATLASIGGAAVGATALALAIRRRSTRASVDAATTAV
jgi:predicted anti-sigma-YlaC factor YlaD